MTDKDNGGAFSFSFGKTDSKSQPSFSFTSQAPTNGKPPSFSFGSAQKKAENEKKGGFSFNGANFGSSSKSPIANSSQQGFSFGLKPIDTDKSAQSHTPSTFSFGAVSPKVGTKTESSSTLKSGDSKPDEEVKRSNSTATANDKTPKEEIKTVDADGDEVKLKKEEDAFMKNYKAPSMESLLHDDEKTGEEDYSDEDDGEFYDMEVDEKTSLPIRKLNYEDDAKSLLSKDEHLKFAVSNRTEQGILFVTESEDQAKDQATSKNEKRKVPKEKKTELFPFDLIPQQDQSSEYRTFLNNLYQEFEPLLLNRKYKHYLEPENDEYMKIGVVSKIKQNREERQLFLRKLMSFTLSYLQTLIKEKMNIDFGKFSDQWVVNYEEVINVLYLLNALHFGNDDETIVLFQQWIERIDIQPDDELLEAVFKDSDKPYQNFAFWSVYVKKLLLRCSFPQLVDDLKVSQYEELENSDNELYMLIENFLSLIESYDPVLFSYDVSAFLRWKKVAVELREAANGVSAKNGMIHSEILELLSILSGSSKTIEDSSSSWYECFMGHFLYQMPSKKLIPEYINSALQVDTYEKPLPGIESWDSICVDLFKEKYLTVIASIEALDKSIGTYVAVLMEAAGLLEKYTRDIPDEDLINKTVAGNGIRHNIDQMVEDLSLTYLNDQKLFAIGVGILISTGSRKSREILSELLPTYEIKDSDDLEWVLSVCSKLKLTKTMRTIQQMQGEKFYEKQLIPNALACFAESSLPEKVVSTVWRLFEDAMLNDGLDPELAAQLFDSDVSKNNAILRQSLSPLYVLNELLIKDRPHDKSWSARLLALLEFRYLPGYYKCGLLLLVYNNLNKNVFDIEDLVALIRCINAYDKELLRDDELRSKSSSMYTLLVDSRPAGTDSPATLSDLLFRIRRGIAMDVSFTFLDDTMY